MKDIALVLWLVLWPVACGVIALIEVKKRKITGEHYPSINDRGATALIELIVWIVVAILI